MRPRPVRVLRPGIAGAVLLAALAALLLGAPDAPAQETELESEEEKTLYFLGSYVGQSLRDRYRLEPDEIDMVVRGIEETLRGEAMELDEQVYGPRINELGQERMAAAVAEEKAAGSAYLEKMAAEEGAVRTESGLIFRRLEEGDGASPSPGDTVTAHYHGTFRDGTVFDSSIERGKPTDFRLTGVIKCWTEALQRMKVGGKARITCPPDLAYGDRGVPPTIPGGATLTFEVELIDIQ